MTGWVLFTVLFAAAATALAVAIWFYNRTLYKGPWYLLLGPADAGRAALLTGARQAATPRRLRVLPAREPGVTWHYFGSGAIVDVAARVAFPSSDPDALGWERTLRLLKRCRPRRPVDGIVLAVPATLFSDAEWLARAHDVGGTMRDRLLQAQRYFGFALPVYLVLTQCESVRGFTAFSRALPAGLLPNMLGWSNPRGADEPFSAEWITEGFTQLHRSIVLAQMELFATRSSDSNEASELLLFSRDITRLMPPVRALLDEVFRPGLHDELFFFRGFYLCGEGAPASSVVDVVEPDQTAIVTTTGAPAVFAGDLLEWKIFPERGLARPLPGPVRHRRRALWVARAAVALLAIALLAGTAYAYMKARQVRAAYEALVTLGGDLLDQRRQLQQGDRTSADEQRLAQTRQFLEQLQAVGPQRLGSVFLPASLVRSLDDRVSDLVTRVMSGVVLGDFHDGLTSRAGAWLAEARTPRELSVDAGPTLKENVFYQRLERFAADYRDIVNGVRRYEQMARGQGPADLSGASDLLALLTGAPLDATAISPVLGRAVQSARGPAISCEVFQDASKRSLVGLRASELLDQFGAASFGDDNPVLSAGAAFSDDWAALMEGADDPALLPNLMDDTSSLAAAVSAWGPIAASSQPLAIPLFAQPPFKRLPDDARVCQAFRPDLSPALARVTALRDRLSARLLALEVEPFGPVIEEGAKGFELNQEIALLNANLDALKAEAFWAPPAIESSGTVPANATWRAEVFDEVLKAADGFDAYRARAFGHLGVTDRQRLLRAVRREVARLVASRLVVTAVPGGPPAADWQQRVNEITALGALMGKAERLVPLLASESPYGVEVLQTLDQQALRALQDVDRMASARYPAVFGQRYDAAFAQWIDVQKSSPSPDALKQWNGIADEQRDGIHQLAQLAAPLVQFVSTRRAADVVRRWRGVVAAVSDFDQKRPNNGFARFDAVFRNGVPSVIPEKGCVARTDRSPGADNGYFTRVQAEIMSEAVRRCRALVEERFTTIASAFNSLLAGQVPFHANMRADLEATPARVVEFLNIYDAQAGRSLRPALEAQGCSADAVTFVRQLESLDALLGSMRTAAPPVPTIDVLPDFRIQSPQDEGADQIAEWQLAVGTHTFMEGAGAKPVPWKSGDPVSLTVRFARDSPDRPVGGLPGSHVENRSVRLEFGGTWGLLHLVRAGRAVADPALLTDFLPTVLVFAIPVERDPETPPLAVAAPPSPFMGSMRLRLYPHGKPEQVLLEDLPTIAPAHLSCPGT